MSYADPDRPLCFDTKTLSADADGGLLGAASAAEASEEDEKAIAGRGVRAVAKREAVAHKRPCRMAHHTDTHVPHCGNAGE